MLIIQIEVKIFLKHLGFLFVCKKSLWFNFLHSSAIMLSSKLVWANKSFFLFTSTTKEIGRHNFKGLGNVTSPLSNNVSRLRNLSASFRQKVYFNRQSCLNLSFYHQTDPFLRAKRHKNCPIKNTLYLWYYNFCLLVINRELRCKGIITL